MNQVHKENLTHVENAIGGRQGLDIEIFGMEGVPADVIDQHNQHVTQKHFAEEAERARLTGNPVRGLYANGQAPPNKRKKVSETLDEIEERADKFRHDRQNGILPAPPVDVAQPNPVSFTSALESAQMADMHCRHPQQPSPTPPPPTHPSPFLSPCPPTAPYRHGQAASPRSPPLFHRDPASARLPPLRRTARIRLQYTRPSTTSSVPSPTKRRLQTRKRRRRAKRAPTSGSSSLTRTHRPRRRWPGYRGSQSLRGRSAVRIAEILEMEMHCGDFGNGDALRRLWEWRCIAETLEMEVHCGDFGDGDALRRLWRWRCIAETLEMEMHCGETLETETHCGETLETETHYCGFWLRCRPTVAVAPRELGRRAY